VRIIDAQSVSKRFLLRHNASSDLKVRFLGLLHRSQRESVEEFWALKNVSLGIDRGESIALVGRNGSGKSTLLKLIAAIYRPTSGRLLVARAARISSMIELGVGFHPELTGRENVFLNAAIHGLGRPEIERLYDSIVDYSGLAHFIDVPIKNYSSGMHMRLGFAIAANLNPDILLLDEIFAVGDASFQQRCTDTVKGFINDGKTMIFVSHSPAAVRAICRRVCVLDGGELNFDGPLEQGLAFYEALIARRATSGAPAPMREAGAPPVTHASQMSDEHLDQAPHRVASGGGWAAMGQWILEFLRSEGLRPSHYVLDVGCGSLAAAVHVVPFLETDHYWGVDQDATLVEAGLAIELPRAGVPSDRVHVIINDTFTLSMAPCRFDFVIANSLFAGLPFNRIAMCIAGVVRALAPSGRFYASWFENPDAADFQPIVRAGGPITYPDRPPYHYPFELIVQACAAVGATVERVTTHAPHPRGETVILITRQSGGSSPVRHV
jgi:ABC-type polysaccharide/polyol phosphate transport system ATPase subunit/SAM-dependent methyltransferase